MGFFSFLKTTKDPFIVGQEWHYVPRENEPNSTILILKIESDHQFGDILHIAITGLQLKNNQSPTGFSEEIGHIPIKKEVLLESVTSLKNPKTQLPDFMEGYTLWKNAFDSGQAGVFSLSVKEIVQAMEDAINQQ